jgi:hypothetical protein
MRFVDTRERLLASTARAQIGLINSRQLRAAGIYPEAQRHRRETGRLEPLLPKILRVGGAPETWKQKLLAVQLWGGPDAFVSHRSAAALWGFDGCPPGGPLEVTSGRCLRSVRAVDVTAHRYTVLYTDEVGELGPFRLTGPARTLLDLAAVVRLDRLEIAMDSALRLKLVSADLLQLTLERHARRGRRGVRAFRAALQARGLGYVPPHAGLERKLARLIGDSDLPPPVREHPIVENGRELYRIDFAYPDRLLAIEADSWRHHSDRISWSGDQVRGNVLAVRGWRLLRFTDHDVTHDPARVLESIGSFF